MKKLFLIAIAAMSLSLVSCTSVEDKAKGYIEDMLDAAKAGDTEKMEKIKDESEEWNKSLSEEDQKVAQTAAQEALKKLTVEDVTILMKAIQ